MNFQLKHLRLLLFPVAVLYAIIVSIRNFLFDKRILPVQEYKIPVILVGNITVGGTGKTPLTEWIIRLFKDDYHVALLSRGYKRKTKGALLAERNSTADDIGDEPKQIKDKFESVTVAVAEKRVEGFDKLLAMDNYPDIVVMDDAYQHRYVKAGLSFLVMDYNRPLWKDFMLPAGDLREPASGKKRADIILVSKCPFNLSMTEQSNIIKRLKVKTDQSVYFSTIGYQQPISLFCKDIFISTEELISYKILLVTGIANPLPMQNYLQTKVKAMESIRFPDHYDFVAEDIINIEKRFNSLGEGKKIILTTEKDAVRLSLLISKDELLASCICYIPIEIEILNGEQKKLRKKITTYVRQIKGDC